MFSEIIYQPDRFVGGDDPATTIRVLAQREHTMMHQNLKLMTMLASAIKQNGVGPLVLTRESQDGVPSRFGIHFQHDAVGNLQLSIVDVTTPAIADEAKQSESDSEPKTEEPTTDEANN